MNAGGCAMVPPSLPPPTHVQTQGWDWGERSMGGILSGWGVKLGCCPGSNSTTVPPLYAGWEEFKLHPVSLGWDEHIIVLGTVISANWQPNSWQRGTDYTSKALRWLESSFVDPGTIKKHKSSFLPCRSHQLWACHLLDPSAQGSAECSKWRWVHRLLTSRQSQPASIVMECQWNGGVKDAARLHTEGRWLTAADVFLCLKHFNPVTLAPM